MNAIRVNFQQCVKWGHSTFPLFQKKGVKVGENLSLVGRSVLNREATPDRGWGGVGDLPTLCMVWRNTKLLCQ